MASRRRVATKHAPVQRTMPPAFGTRAHRLRDFTSTKKFMGCTSTRGIGGFFRIARRHSQAGNRGAGLPIERRGPGAAGKARLGTHSACRRWRLRGAIRYATTGTHGNAGTGITHLMHMQAAQGIGKQLGAYRQALRLLHGLGQETERVRLRQRAKANGKREG